MEILALVSGAKDKKSAIWAKVSMPGKKKIITIFLFLVQFSSYTILLVHDRVLMQIPYYNYLSYQHNYARDVFNISRICGATECLIFHFGQFLTAKNSQQVYQFLTCSFQQRRRDFFANCFLLKFKLRKSESVY